MFGYLYVTRFYAYYDVMYMVDLLARPSLHMYFNLGDSRMACSIASAPMY